MHNCFVKSFWFAGFCYCLCQSKVRGAQTHITCLKCLRLIVSADAEAHRVFMNWTWKGIAVSACQWMLHISYFSSMKDASRGNSCLQLHQTDSLQRGQTCMCRPKEDSKDFWYIFFFVFVNHWEHIFYGRYNRSHFFIIVSEEWTHSLEFGD